MSRGPALHTRADRRVTVIEPPSWRALRPLAALRRLAGFADLLITLSLHRVSVRYKQSRLGAIWAVLQPLAIMATFAAVFALLGGAHSEGVPYPLFAYAALVPWTAFASGLSSATGSLTGHASLLGKVSFPREILPLTYVVAAVTDAALACIALGGLMAWYGIGLSPTALWSLLAIGLLVIWLVVASLFLSAVQVRHRDVGLAIPVLLQIWMFATPVVYPLSLARTRLPPAAFLAYVLNPMAGIVDTFRRGVVLGSAPDWLALGAAIAVILLLLPLAYAYFKLAELTMADVV
ncbi:MAG TPA: ABC transporter permease [Vicinamibacterales bacterium]|nr:ABC transporter permease [Vicinamibacterales bacterium]